MSQVPMSFAFFFPFLLRCIFCLDAFLLILKLWFWGGYVYVSFANIWEMSVPFLNYCVNLKLLWKSLSNNNNSRNSPRCPVVSIWCFHSWGPWFNSWSDRQDPTSCAVGLKIISINAIIFSPQINWSQDFCAYCTIIQCCRDNAIWQLCVFLNKGIIYWIIRIYHSIFLYSA